MRAFREEEDTFEIPLTSLIDVVFLLLIFFLVATNFRPKERDHKVDLPNAAGGAPGVANDENLIVKVSRDGALIVEGRVIDPTELRAIMADWKAKNPDKRVAIRGDEHVPYQKVMWVMGTCQAVGILNVDLPVEPLGEMP